MTEKEKSEEKKKSLESIGRPITWGRTSRDVFSLRTAMILEDPKATKDLLQKIRSGDHENGVISLDVEEKLFNNIEAAEKKL